MSPLFKNAKTVEKQGGKATGVENIDSRVVEERSHRPAASEIVFFGGKYFCMELATVDVLKDNFAMICCPFCGIKQRVSADKFKGKKSRITVRCKCESRFKVQFNSRKSYRKSVAIAGAFMTLPSNMSTERRMRVHDLSRNGLRFKMIDTVVVKKGDELFVRFNLDDAKRSLIHKKVVVRFVNDDFLGCEFTELSLYEKELGFYLLA